MKRHDQTIRIGKMANTDEVLASELESASKKESEIK